MSEQEERKLTIPVLYVDAAEVHVFPYTVQIVLGVTTPDGVVPHVQLALAPGFAVQLVETLQRAVHEYNSPKAIADPDAK